MRGLDTAISGLRDLEQGFKSELARVQRLIKTLKNTEPGNDLAIAARACRSAALNLRSVQCIAAGLRQPALLIVLREYASAMRELLEFNRLFIDNLHAANGGQRD